MKKPIYQVTKLCDDRITNLLDYCSHQLTAKWALDVAHHVLYLFEDQNPSDERPRQALRALEQWIDGKISVSESRKFALAAHHAAKNATDPAAIAAARTSGHACAVCHVKTHAYGVSMYGILASMYPSQGDSQPEREWQYNHLIELMNMKS